MFCPNCGRDNSNELKFCASCGTDLDAVSRALAGREEDVVTRLDAGLDQFISRYTEHIFTEPAPLSGDRSVVRSWRLLGQAFVTSMIDLFMFIIMWNILPCRFLLLLITSPIRMMAEKNRKLAAGDLRSLEYEVPVFDKPKQGFLQRGVPSVTEETTTNLSSKTVGRGKVPITDKLE